MLKLFIQIAALFLLIALTYPATTFFYELATHPADVFTVSYLITPIQDAVIINITITYNGSVPLTPFNATIAIVKENEVLLSGSAYRDTLNKGDSVTISLEVPYDILQESKPEIRINLSPNGILPMQIRIREAG
jgi:hypothetical protein